MKKKKQAFLKLFLLAKGFREEKEGRAAKDMPEQAHTCFLCSNPFLDSILIIERYERQIKQSFFDVVVCVYLLPPNMS